MFEALDPYRFVAVVALLGLAAHLAAPGGRLPLALRGLRRTLRRDAGLPEEPRGEAKASPFRRFIAIVLAILSFLLAVA